MRLQRVMPACAAAITLAAGAAPAHAFDNRAPEFGTSALVSPSAGPAHSSGGSSSTMVDLGAGLVAGVAIGSLGLAAVTRRSAGTARRPAGVATGR